MNVECHRSCCLCRRPRKKVMAQRGRSISLLDEALEQVCVKCETGNPIVVVGIYLIVLIIFFIFMSLTKHWYSDYGYYVPHWTYEGWGGPAYWGTLDEQWNNDMSSYDAKYKETYGRDPVRFGVCDDGLRQSPIDIQAGLWNTSSQPPSYSDAQQHFALGDVISLKSAYYAPYFDHSLLKFYCHKGPGACGSLYWRGKQGVDTYQAHYIEIHAPSEHTIDMVRFPMEMQVYHCNGECDINSEYVVVSMLFSVGNSSSSQELETLWGPDAASFETAKEYKQRKYKKKGKYKEMKPTKKMVDMSRLYDLSAGFFHYEGSLTSPPCVESMHFLIQSGPAKISMEQLLAVQDLIGYPGNARPQQMLNNRQVTYHFRPLASTLPYRVMPATVTKGSFQADPPEWAHEEYCANKHEHPTSETTTSETTTEKPSDAKLFYDCSQAE